jgi:hypothetical protein
MVPITLGRGAYLLVCDASCALVETRFKEETVVRWPAKQERKIGIWNTCIQNKWETIDRWHNTKQGRKMVRWHTEQGKKQ